MRRTLRAAVVVVLMSGTLIATQASPASASTLIQPGDRMIVADTTAIGSCTLGFVYDGVGALAGNVYVGTAAHCVTHVGQDVRLLYSPHVVFGDVAVIGNLGSSATDWALIQVRSEYVPDVSPAMKGHPQFPTGVTSPEQTNVGDPIQLNDLLFVFKPWVPLTYDDSEIYRVGGTLSMPPSVLPFDSGGPLVHVPTGRALGQVSQGLNCSLPSLVCEEYEGPTVEGILAKASAAGFPVALATVQ